MKKSKPKPQTELQATALFVENLIQQAIKGKENIGIDDLYKRGIEYHRGKHKISTNTDKQGNQVWNKFSEIVTSRVSNVADTRPKWIFTPNDKTNDVFTSNALNQIIGDVIWEDCEWEDKGEDSLLDAAFGGSSHIKTGMRKTDGWPTFTTRPCSLIIPDPKATKNKNLRFIIDVIPENVKDIEKKYGFKEVIPEAQLEVSDKASNFDNVKITFEQESATSFSMPNIWDKYGFENAQDKSLGDVIGMALTYEVWMEDKSEEPIPFKEEDVIQEHSLFGELKIVEVDPKEKHIAHISAHEEYLETLDPLLDKIQIENILLHIKAHSEFPLEEKRRKYPLGRVVTYCQGQIYDRPNPLPIHWRDVFIKWDWLKVLLSYWGKPLTEDLFDPQDALNHRKNAITKNINSQNVGIVKVSRAVYKFLFPGSNKAKLTKNVEGHVIPMNSPNDLIRDNGPALGAHVMNDPIMIEGFMDRNAGENDIMSGKYPSGSPGVGTVDQLLGQAQKPINMVVKHYAFALKKVARNAIVIMNEFMDDETKFRILGKEEYEMVRWADLKDKAGLYDVKVDVMGQMSNTRERRFQRAITMAREGHYDTQAVLEEDDDPKKFDILQRMDKVRQLQMIVEAQSEIIEEKDKELNTAINRMQGSDGKGNAGKTNNVQSKSK